MDTTTPKNVALIVHSCDRYELLYRGFEFFFSKYWDFNADCNYYFATEEKEVSIPDFANIRSGKGEWADRLAFLLREKIAESYVLYFQEDMWLNEPARADFFNHLFKITAEKSWRQVKLHSSEVYRTTPTDIFIEGLNVAMLDNTNSDFLMSHQVTLWEKNFLLQQLHKKEHPWRNERKGTQRLKKLNPEILQVDYFSENGKPAINANKAGAAHSAYHTISVNGLLNDTVQPYLKLLQDAGPDMQPYAAKLIHNFTHQLTHDGRPKPRKEDIFKKIKNRLKGK